MTIVVATSLDPSEVQPVSNIVPEEGCRHTATLEMVIESLQSLRPKQVDEVWKFIQFLDYKDFLEDSTEDALAWRMVQENEKYKELHPDEPLEVFASGEDFLKASENW